MLAMMGHACYDGLCLLRPCLLYSGCTYYGEHLRGHPVRSTCRLSRYHAAGPLLLLLLLLLLPLVLLLIKVKG
jgi:hypothetical protein